MEFKAFPEIKKLGSVVMSITQKIHGTNAHILVYRKFKDVHDGVGSMQVEDGFDLACGSRTRFIVPGDDNYNFATHVYANKQAFIDLLGEGRHDGEWAGKGINSGEGLEQKVFVLFDYYRYKDKPLPPRTVLVPVLYEGPIDLNQVQIAMDELKTNGSKLSSGFMHPEGVVVRIKDERYKVVFEEEETQWTGKPKKGNSGENTKPKIDVSHLLQPIRLEKLLSKDERYLTGYPKSLPQITKDYIADLIKEGQITGTDAEVKGMTKTMGGQLFRFIQSEIETKHAMNIK